MVPGVTSNLETRRIALIHKRLVASQTSERLEKCKCSRLWCLCLDIRLLVDGRRHCSLLPSSSHMQVILYRPRDYPAAGPDKCYGNLANHLRARGGVQTYARECLGGHFCMGGWVCPSGQFNGSQRCRQPVFSRLRVVACMPSWSYGISRPVRAPEPQWYRSH